MVMNSAIGTCMELSKFAEAVTSEWLEFKVTKIRNAKAVWRAPQYSNYDFSCDNLFLNSYAYAISDAECFNYVEFDSKDSVQVFAERYGGFGIYKNGGGARAGTLKNAQLKGIGPNCLVGDHDDLQHKHGSLDNFSAITETIYSNVLDKILPKGTIKVIGLIEIPESYPQSTINSDRKYILVREPCIRVGHFLRASEFQPKLEYKSQLACDVARVKRSIKRLPNILGGHDDFKNNFLSIIENNATQFGFAQAARILHGTLSPSNISLDGKWLDLPLAGFVASGTNYCITSNLYTEHKKQLNYLLEMLHNYCKYNYVRMDKQSFVNFYRRIFENSFDLGIAYCLGIQKSAYEHLRSAEFKMIARTFRRIIRSGKHIDVRRSVPTPNDPVKNLIVGSFVSLTDSSQAHCFLSVANLNENEIKIYSEFFSTIVETISLRSKTSRKLTIILMAIKAIKRAFISDLFYLTSVTEVVSEKISKNDRSLISPLINLYLDIAEWGFKEEENIVTVIKYNNLEIKYFVTSENYQVTYADSKGIFYKKFEEIYSYHFKQENKSRGSFDSSLITYIHTLNSALFCIENGINDE